MTEPSSRPTQIALLVAGAFFMENLDGTVIATALPAMAQSFAASPVALNIGMTAYLLTLAVFIPVSGWFADRFGSREVFALAITIFTGASILCGLTQGVATFTAARVLQGIGGAMMVPVGRLVVLRTTEKRDLMRSMTFIVWPGLVAPVIGPPLGGLITQTLSWRWIFFLNVPLGLVGLGLALWLIPHSPKAEGRPLDIPGFLLTGLACCGFLYGLDLVSTQPTPWPWVLGLVASALLAGMFAVVHLRRATNPLFDLSTIRIRTFAMTLFGGSLFRLAISAVPFLLPLLFQIGFGLDPFTSGLLVLCVFAGNLGMKVAATQTIHRFGFRRVLIVNGALCALTLFAFAVLTPQTSIVLLVVVLVAGGLTRSLQFSALTTISFADVPPAQMSAANALSAMVVQLNSGFGIALGALALHGAAAFAGRQDVALADFHVAFVFVGFLCLLGIVDCFGLPENAGAEVSGHRREAASHRS